MTEEKKPKFMKKEPDKKEEVDLDDLGEIDAVAEALCKKANEFNLRDREGRLLKSWEGLKDGSSRSEYELTMWKQLAIEAIETSWKF